MPSSGGGVHPIAYDSKLNVIQHALGTHTAVSRVQGTRLKAKREIRIASLFRDAPAAFLRMIVVHELAHLKEREHDRAFYALAEEWLDRRSPGDWNQALMELGATVCTPRDPGCAGCPVRAGCEARAQGAVERFPEKRPRRRPVEVAVAEGPAWVHPGDEDPVAQAEPWVAFLPSLDPTTMGWKERAFTLGDHGAFAGPLFDRNGNAGPTVWADGRVVGGWAQAADGTVVYRLLSEVPRRRVAQLEREAVRLSRLLEGTVVKPRFPTALQRELATGE